MPTIPHVTETHISGAIGPDSAEGVFPKGRLAHLVRAVLGGNAQQDWALYVEALGSQEPNEGETRTYPLVATRLGPQTQHAPMADHLLQALRWARSQRVVLAQAKDQVSALLQRAQTPGLWTKGTALTQMLYRPDEFRVSKDVDVIVRWSDISRIVALADTANWSPKLVARQFDDLGEMESSEISFAIPGLVDVDFSWQPRLPFAFDPALRTWLWDRSDQGMALQPANPTWLLLETFQHGMSGNKVFPIRWVIDAVLLLDRQRAMLDWPRLVALAQHYHLTTVVRHGLRIAAAFTDAIPPAVLEQFEALPTSRLEEQEFAAKVTLDDLATNLYATQAHNLLLRANPEQFQRLATRLWPGSAADLDLRARLEQRLADGRTGLPATWSPDAPLTNPAATPAELEAEARRLGRDKQQTLAHFHWKAAHEGAPDHRGFALGYANTLHHMVGPEPALAALQEVCRQHPTFWNARQSLATQLVRMKAYSEAKRECDAILQANPAMVSALSTRGECLRHLLCTDDAIHDLTRAAELSPDQPNIWLKLGQVLLTAGHLDQVVAHAATRLNTEPAWTEFNILVARAMFRLGDRDGAAARFNALDEMEPQNAKIGIAALQEALGAESTSTVKDQVLAFARRFPGELGVYRLALTCLERMPEDAEIWSLIQDAPQQLRHGTEFQIAILLRAYHLNGRFDACREILRVQVHDHLPVELSVTRITLLWTVGEVEAAYGRLKDLLVEFPQNLKVLRCCIMVFGSRSPEALRDIKAELIQRLSPLERCDLLANVPAHFLDSAEKAMAMEWRLKEGGLTQSGVRQTYLANKIHVTDTAALDALLQADFADVPMFEVLQPVLQARRNHALTSLPELAARGPAAVGNYSRISADAAGRDIAAPQAYVDAARVLTGLIGTDERPSWMDTAEDPGAALSLCDWLAARITAGTPTSVIRLGDGEGQYLPYPRDILHLQDKDRAMVQRSPWWGAELIGPEQGHVLSDALVQAIGAADLIGIPPASRIATELGWPARDGSRNGRGIRAIFNHLGQTQNQGLFASCNLHADLERWQLYGRLLAGCKSVSVISCHDLTAALHQKFALQTRVLHQIPSEYLHRRSFVGQKSVRSEGVIFPDVFNAIMANLKPEPGEVHLVAAGFLGKLFCDRIRSKGGIALDVGSLADSWARFRTRAYYEPD